MTVTEIRTKFPELTAGEYSDAVVQSAIDDSADLNAPTDRARMYCVAHLVTSGEKCPLLRHETGPISASYERTGERATAKYWHTTRYGRLYLQLIRARPGPGVLVV